MPKVPNDLGNGGAKINTDLKNLINALVDDITSVRAELADLKTKYNQHIADGKHRVASAIDAAAPQASVASTLSVTKSDY